MSFSLFTHILLATHRSSSSRNIKIFKILSYCWCLLPEYLSSAKHPFAFSLYACRIVAQKSLALIRWIRRRTRNALLMSHPGWRAIPEPHYAVFVTSSVLTVTKRRRQGLRDASIVSNDFTGLLVSLSQRVVWRFDYNY